MDLATITAGGGFEEIFFLTFGAIIMSINLMDTWYKRNQKGAYDE